MSVLAIDLGTRTGWCARLSGMTTSGTLDLSGRRHEGGGMRYLRFHGWLNEMHQASPIRAIFYEEVRAHRGVDAAHVYGGLLAVLTSWCEAQTPPVPYRGVPVAAIKKHVTGKGNADKDAVKAGVRKFGFEPGDDNEADAIALMLLQLESPEAQALL